MMYLPRFQAYTLAKMISLFFHNVKKSHRAEPGNKAIITAYYTMQELFV